MIVSHKHKFIFIKTRKTAGTSIEIALSRFCGGKDIITPISPEDEKTRKELGFQGPQNFYIPFTKYRIKELRAYITSKERLQFYNHIVAEKVRTYINSRVWRTYYKFCFERNPWDKALSLYYWRTHLENSWRTHNKKPRPSLSEYLSYVKNEALSNFHIYSIDGQLAMDHIGLYENLDSELDKIRQILGLPDKIQLPHAKGSYRKDRKHYSEVMDEEEKKVVAQVCKREIVLFNYTF